MPEQKKKGNVLTRKVGPLPAWGWGAVGVGAFLAFKWYSARKAAANAVSGTALSGGTTIPGPGSGSSGGLPTFSSLGAWEQAAISAMSGASLSPADALNGLTDWINGQCVTQAQFNGISSIISTVGLPPGFSTVPQLTVCAAPTTPTPTTTTPAPSAPAPAAPAPSNNPPGPPPNAPAAALVPLAGQNQYVVDTQWNPIYQEWVYLTNLGGIFNVNGSGGPSPSGFFGSILDLPSGGPNGIHANWFNMYGQAQRQAAQLKVNPDGGYTIVDTQGESYTFGPQSNYAGK